MLLAGGVAGAELQGPGARGQGLVVGDWANQWRGMWGLGLGWLLVEVWGSAGRFGGGCGGGSVFDRGGGACYGRGVVASVFCSPDLTSALD